MVHYADGDVNAVPYDYPVIGYGTENVGTLRLWQAETDDEFDFGLFNQSRFLLLVNPSDRPLEFEPGSPANIYANGERVSAEPLYQTSGAVSVAPRSVLLLSAIGTHE